MEISFFDFLEATTKSNNRFSIKEYDKIRELTNKDIFMFNNNNYFKHIPSNTISFNKFYKTEGFDYNGTNQKLVHIFIIVKGEDDYFYTRNIMENSFHKLDQFNSVKSYVINNINKFDKKIKIYY